MLPCEIHNLINWYWDVKEQTQQFDYDNDVNSLGENINAANIKKKTERSFMSCCYGRMKKKTHIEGLCLNDSFVERGTMLQKKQDDNAQIFARCIQIKIIFTNKLGAN